MTNRPAGLPSVSGPTRSQAETEPDSNRLRRAIQCAGAGKYFGYVSVAALLLLIASSISSAQTLTPGWNQLSPPTTPPERFGTALAYDATHSQVVMFGGFGHTAVMNDTWLWNGTNWTQVFPGPSPSARNSATMVYDATHGLVVLFGGSDSSNTRLNDTWTWDGTNWTNVTPASGNPPGRNGASMTYDAAHGRVVLFGGISTSNTTLGDTWVWNGSTWTSVTPPSGSPTARFGAMMAYDAAMGQVILFGGYDGQENNDTWALNGTTWTKITPASGSPTARDSGAIAYNDALGQLVLFGGESAINGPYLNDTWVWNGSTWAQQTSAAVPGVRQANSLAYDAALQQVIMFGGLNGGFNHNSDTWIWGLPQNFGNMNACPGGNTTPAPCSNTLALTYTFPTTTNLGGIQVFTQGAPNLDFNQANGNTCTATIQAGTSCTLNVTFAPTAPGLRLGALNLYDNSVPSNLLVSTPIYGNGQAAVASFSPLVTYVESTGTFPLSGPKGVAVDAAGDIFVSDTGNSRVVEIKAFGAGEQIVGTGFVSPQGLAVDGAGNVYVADPGLNPSFGEVVEVPSGCASAACQVVVYNPAPHPSPLAVAVDGIGNLYVADNPLGVVKIPPGCIVASSSSTCQTNIGTGFSQPTGVAVDANGNVFVSDSGLKQVIEIPAGCTTNACQVPIGTGWNQPQSVSLDAAGDVYVADSSLNEVVEVPVGCGSATCQIIAASTSFLSLGSGFQPYDAKVDPRGNLYIADYGLSRLDNYPQGLEALNFSASYVNNVSGDSPLSFTFQNIGNQTLSAISPGLVFTDPDFTQALGTSATPDCNSTFSLVPGEACNLAVRFDPLSPGSLTGNAVFYDNSLNNPSLPQSFPFTGQGVSNNYVLTVSGGGIGFGSVQSTPTGIACNILGGLSSGGCSASFSGEVSLQAIPGLGFTFTGWGGACISQGSNPVCTLTLNAATAVSASFGIGVIPPDTVSVALQGSGGGNVTTSPSGINCILSGGAISGICGSSFPNGSQLTITATPTTGSTFAGWISPCTGTNPTCIFTLGANTNVAAIFNQGVFGKINVCPKGSNSPAPCSQSLPVTFNIPQTTNLGAIQVITQGTADLDFSLGNSNSCSGAISGGNSCTVNVTFTPLAPGLRLGAVSLYDNSGALIATQPISGIGQSPLAAFGPAAQTVVNTTASYPLNTPNGAVVDAAGNLYIADAGNQRVVKVAANGSVSTVGSGLNYPQGLAIDGAGDLYIADNNLNQVVEVTPAGVQTEMNFGLSAQLGVAVDGAGDVFVSSFNTGQVVEAPPGCTTGSCTTVIYSAPTGLHPVGLATDAAGNVFVTALSYPPGSSPGQVVRIPAGCTTSACQVLVGSGWSAPEAVAVDAAGDVFVADEAPKIVEVPAGCSASACQITLSTALAYGIAVDANGDIIIPDRGSDANSNQVIVLGGSQPPSISFALTNVGLTSADSPRAVSVQNVGNQPLIGTMASSNLASNFSAIGSCSSFSLAPGAMCSQAFSFTPQSPGQFTGTAFFSDNTLNLSSAVVLQPVSLTGIGGINGQATTTPVPNVVGLTQQAASAALTAAGLTTGSISTGPSDVVPSGSVIASNPAAGTQVGLTSPVKLLLSTGPSQPPSPNPLTFLNNYFVTGDYAVGGVTLRTATISNNTVTGTINIQSGTGANKVPTGADLIDGLLYWATLESSSSPSGASVTFLGYPITGQQIGSDQPYTDPGTNQTGTLRVYRANVNAYFQNGTGGIRVGSGSFAVTMPAGTSNVLLTEGASLVVIYRVLSPSFPLKAIVIYDGSAVLTSASTQNMQGYYDALGGGNATGEVTSIFADSTGWNTTSTNPTLGGSSQYNAPLNANAAFGSVILSTAVANTDNDGILDAWKDGPSGSDFHSGEPGYYDVKTGAWVALPGAQHGHKDLFVQLDYMCGAVLSNGACDPNQENLFPSPDSLGNDPLAMVQKAFANSGLSLHLQIGNAVPESTCVDSPGQPCQFPGQPGVIGWKNSLEFSKAWPRNFDSCVSGGDCSPRFAYGQKDSYHYVLFGHSLAIPAWNSRYNTLTSINAVAGGTTTISTTDRGKGINACPARITISGIQGMPALNGIYNTSSCPDTSTIIIATPTGVTNWSYPNNTLPEPIIGITSGTVTSISGYSDLGGADSAVTLGLWETYPNQDMSKRATVVAGTLFHELGHTLGLGHGGIYYDGGSGNYVPTFEANCKPNYQSIMNYLFQLDGVGPSSEIAFSNQTLTTLNQGSLNSVLNLADGNSLATFPTSSWYVPNSPNPNASAATLHCDGTPLAGDVGYRISGSVDPITPSWSNSQNITFDGQHYTQLRGFNDLNNLDLRQIGATGGEFASLSSVLAFGSRYTPLNIAPGGTVSVGAGGNVTLGAGGTITLGGGGNVTVPSGGSVNTSSTVTFGTGGNITLGAGGTVTAGSNGVIGLVSGGGNITLGAGGTITLGGGGNITLGGGGTVTLGAGGTITLGGGGSVTVPAGGSYSVPAGGTVTLGAGGNITLGGGGTVTLGGGGNVTLGGGGNVTLGAGGTITLGAGGTVTLGGGGNITLGGGGNVTLGGGGTITLGAGGNVTLGGGGNVTLGGGGTVTLGAGGDLSVGAGGNVTLGGGGTVTLGAGGNITLGAGGTVTLGGGGNVTLGAGGNITLGGGGNVTMNSAGNVTLGAGGSVTFGAGGGSINGASFPAGGPYPVGAGGNVTLGAGGFVTLGAGGNVTLGAGGNVTLGGGGNITLGAGGNITLGGGGTVTLGGGGNVTLGAGGFVTLGAGGNVTLGAGGNVTLGAGGNITLGGGGNFTSELDYDTANSVVRPPPSATYSLGPNGSVQVSWTPPAFGVVQTYTVSRSIFDPNTNTTSPAVLVGMVSGVNGNPPATTLPDPTPPPGTLIYTVTSTLVPDQNTNTQRQSDPSPPAVLTLDQTIVLGALQSSYVLSAPPATTPPVTITATAETGNSPNMQTVSFAVTGNCSVGDSSIDQNGVSSASITLTGTGSCNITASQAGDSTTAQPGTNAYNAAPPVTATFAIVNQTSSTTPQTINLQLPNIRYGNTFALNATDNSGLPINYQIVSGPCALNGTVSGIGQCTVTASADAGTASGINYSAISVTQSFNISPAILMVTAGNLTTLYGQIPSLTNDYAITGFVNGESQSSVVTGAPTLSTTATATSAPAIYPITIVTGTLSATNYTFNFVPGNLNIQSGTQTITFTTPAPASAPYKGTFPVAATSTSQLAVTLSVDATSTSVCSLSGGIVTMNSGTGKCTIDANQSGNANYSAATQVQSSANATAATQTITFTTPAPASAPYKGTFPVAATSTSQLAVTLSVDATSTSVCSLSGGIVTMNSGAGKCTIDANQPGNANFGAAAQVQSSTNATPATQTISFSPAAPGSAAYHGTFSVAASSTSQLPVTLSVDPVSTSICSLSGGTVTMTSGAGECTIDANQAGNANFSAATQVQSSTNATPATQTITFGPAAPASAPYHGTFSVAASSTSQLPVTLSVDPASTSVCSLTSGTVTMNSGAGKCTIDANQSGNANYSAATQVQSSANATAATQTITFTTPAPASAPYKGTFPVAATSTSQLAVTLSVDATSTSVCSLSGGIVTMNSGAGKCTIDANQPGNANFGAAAQVQSSATATPAAQTITFTQPVSPVTYGVAPITLQGSSTSTLPVSFSIGPSSTASATISGTTLTIKGAGTVIVDADQPGNANYTAAPRVQRSIVVNKAVLTVTANSVPRTYGEANPIFTATIAPFVNNDAPGVVTGSPSLTTTADSSSYPGTYTITAAQGNLAATNYTFSFINGTLTVTPTASIPASSTACNGAYTGTFKGNLTISKGQNCIFVSGGTTGSITETGGNLVLQGASSGGGVTVNGGGTFTIGPSATITGSLTIERLPKSTTSSQVCGSTINGNLVIQSNGAPVVVGSGTTSCALNTIKGSLQVSSNSAAVTMNGNKVTGSIQVQSNSGATIINANTVGVSVQDQSNTGATQVFSNIITNALQCQSNSSITGGGNKAATKQGQCASF